MDKPNPGSKEAIDQGCCCPIADNHYGRGVNGEFWYNSGCRLHVKKHRNTCSNLDYVPLTSDSKTEMFKKEEDD